MKFNFTEVEIPESIKDERPDVDWSEYKMFAGYVMHEGELYRDAVIYPADYDVDYVKENMIEKIKSYIEDETYIYKKD